MATPPPPPESKSLAVFSDGITSLSYIKETSHLASTSWDGAVRIHDTQADKSSNAILAQTMESGPLLSLATPSSMEAVVTGGLDGSVRLLDLPTGKSPRLIGNPGTTTNNENNSSKDACSCLQSLDGENPNIVASASWNKHFYLWDIRSTSTSPVCTLELPGKAFCMDVDRTHNRIVVATSGRKTCFIDIKAGKAESLALERDSSLKYPTRCVQFFPQGEGIAIGSVEGRVGVEFLDELGIPSTMKKYAFKCHRINDTVYPVNCIAFHPRFVSTFATGGCDGGVVLWDGMNKKKLTTLKSYPTSISALCFNHDGSELAVASSYTYEEGDREHPQDEIFIRQILDSECQPKPK